MVNVYRVNITYRRIAKLVQKTTVKQFLIGVNCLLCQFANDRKIFDIIDVVKLRKKNITNGIFVMSSAGLVGINAIS